MAAATPERCLRVRLLLALEADRGIHGRDEAPAGAPAPTLWLDCPDCAGTGRKGACSSCAGRGLMLVDPYTAAADLRPRKLGEAEARRETMELYEIDQVLARLAEQARERGETEARLVEDERQAGEPYEPWELRRVLASMRDGPAVLAACYDAVRAVHVPSIGCLACCGRGTRRRSSRPGDVAVCLACQGSGKPVWSARIRLLEELGVRWVAIRFRGRIALPPDGEREVAEWRRSAA